MLGWAFEAHWQIAKNSYSISIDVYLVLWNTNLLFIPKLVKKRPNIQNAAWLSLHSTLEDYYKILFNYAVLEISRSKYFSVFPNMRSKRQLELTSKQIDWRNQDQLIILKVSLSPRSLRNIFSISCAKHKTGF